MVWVAICIALVFFMQAGFALLECGTSRSKNAINVVMKNYTDICVGSLVFWAVGYGIMFGTSFNGIIGTDNFLPSELSTEQALAIAYQIMFAATAATIFSGAAAERIRYLPYLVFSIIATALIYPIFGSWVWNADGWLAQLGFIDFAGSTVVHSVGAWCALAGILVLGPRLGRFSQRGDVRNIPGHNLPMVALGGFILWLGWFGFNGGSIASLDSDNLGTILLNTHLGACAGAVGVLIYMAVRRQPVLMTTTINGSIAGLVSITAGAASLSPLGAIAAGFIGGLVFMFGSQLLRRARIDDVVDAIAAHGFCGAWGTLAVALFPAVGAMSLTQVAVQIIGITAAFLWTFCSAYLIFLLLDKAIGLRASSLHEQRGLDYTEHYELGYPEFQESFREVQSTPSLRKAA